MTFFNQLVIDNTQLRQFVSHTAGFKTFNRAEVVFQNSRVCLTVFSRGARLEHKFLELAIACEPSDWQLSAIAQVCRSLLPPIPSFDQLEIRQSRKSWQDGMENVQWLELLQTFRSVRRLVLSSYKVVGLVAPALQELARESVIDLIPELQELFIKTTRSQLVEPTKEAFGKFLAARKTAGRRVAVSNLVDNESGVQYVQ